MRDVWRSAGWTPTHLVRSYRLGHQAVVRIVLDEIRAAHLDTQLGLDVFEQITSTSFRYIDRISRLVLTRLPKRT